MNKTIMAAIRAHALEESPRECCGFVIQSGRRQRYIPIPNTHENPTEHFRIDGEHWANAEDKERLSASSILILAMVRGLSRQTWIASSAITRSGLGHLRAGL
jgi:proteasome lid subunit RPN8/RPN11